MTFSINTSVKGTQQSVETSIGTIEVGSAVIISTPHGNRQHTVTEIASRTIKTDYQMLKFDRTHLGWVEMGAYATIKIVEIVA